MATVEQEELLKTELALAAISARLEHIETMLQALTEMREVLFPTIFGAITALSGRLAGMEKKLDRIVPLADAFNALQDSPMAKMLGITNGEG